MDGKKNIDFLMELGGEWINCKHNLPMASNMGGSILQEVSFQLCLEIIVRVSTVSSFVHYCES